MDKKTKENLSNQFIITGFNPEIKLNKFEENSINSLEDTSKYNKLYIKGTKLIFTFDKNNNFTQILTIDLNTYKHSYKRINKIGKNIFNAKKSNSYLFEDKIFSPAWIINIKCWNRICIPLGSGVALWGVAWPSRVA